MRNLRQVVKVTKQKVKRLEAKVSALIESQAIALEEHDGDDIA